MMQQLKRILKWFSLTVLAAIIAYIIQGYFLSLGWGRDLLKEFLSNILLAIKSPTPLWATIALVLLFCLYIHVRIGKIFERNQTQGTSPKEIDITIRLDPVKEKILNIVATNDRLYDEQIAKLADIKKQLSTLHLHELREAKFVRSSSGIDENSYKVDIWFIEQQGRKYLSHHGLL